jgi:hypothetical protein
VIKTEQVLSGGDPMIKSWWLQGRGRETRQIHTDTHLPSLAMWCSALFLGLTSKRKPSPDEALDLQYFVIVIKADCYNIIIIIVIWNSGNSKEGEISGLCAVFLFCFGGCRTRVWTQVCIFTKQVFYHLSHPSSPLCSGYFGFGVSQTICSGWPWTMILPISVSKVAGIRGVSHQCSLCVKFALINWMHGWKKEEQRPVSFDLGNCWWWCLYIVCAEWGTKPSWVENERPSIQLLLGDGLSPALCDYLKLDFTARCLCSYQPMVIL